MKEVIYASNFAGPEQKRKIYFGIERSNEDNDSMLRNFLTLDFLGNNLDRFSVAAVIAETECLAEETVAGAAVLDIAKSKLKIITREETAPGQITTALLLAHPEHLTFRVLLSLRLRGVRRIILGADGEWHPRGITAIGAAKIRRRIRIANAKRTQLKAPAPANAHRNLDRIGSDSEHVLGTVSGRIVFVVGSLRMGGAERQAMLACEHLSKRTDTDVHLIVLDSSGDQPLRRHINSSNVTVHTLDDLATQSYPDDAARSADMSILARISHLPLKQFRSILALRSLFAELKPAQVHCWQDHANLEGGIAARIAGVANVALSTRSLSPLRFPYFEWFMQDTYLALLSGGATLLNNSNAGRQDYASWLGVPADRIKVVRNALRTPLETEDDGAVAPIQEFNFDPSWHVVGGVFSFLAVKRPLLWIETAHALTRLRDDVGFVLIGDGPIHGSAVRMIERLGMEDRFRIVGRIDAPAPLVRQMSVQLLTSRFEGLPNVLIEGLAEGVPFVATDVGGVSELLEFSTFSRALNTDDPAALAEAVSDCLRALDERTADAEPVDTASVQTEFSLQRMMSETTAAYGIDLPEDHRDQQ